MLWIYIAVISYLFTAVANILDKFLLTRFLKAPAIYAFYVGVLQILIVVLIPFGVMIPALNLLGIALVAGALFTIGLFWMYKGFLQGETTRVATLIGGSLPIYTFILSYFFLGERLSHNQLWAFLFLILGMFTITFEAVARTFQKTRSNSYIRISLFAGLLFSLAFVGSDLMYTELGFITGFFWLRIGSFLMAVLFLLVPLFRSQIVSDLRRPGKEQGRAKSLVLTNQLIGSAGFVLLNIAIDLGSVTLVNALQGLQYVFIFIIAAILGKWIREVREPSSPRIALEKAIAIIFILIGLGFLAFG